MKKKLIILTIKNTTNNILITGTTIKNNKLLFWLSFGRLSLNNSKKKLYDSIITLNETLILILKKNEIKNIILKINQSGFKVKNILQNLKLHQIKIIKTNQKNIIAFNGCKIKK